jgi:hypothetical protein
MDTAKEKKVEQNEMFVLRQTYFSVKNNNAIVWKSTITE